jgi:hypothetical protein
MIWFGLAVLVAGWHLLLLVGRLWGTDGVMVILMLVLAALVLVVFGGCACLAFALKLPLFGWLFTILMIGQLVHIGWNTYQGLR